MRWLTDYDLGERDVVGRSHYEVFPEIPERWKEVHRRCLAGAVESCEEDAFPRPDGTTDWLRWEVQPWRKADDTIGGIIIFSERVSERKRAEEALAQRAQELARSNADLAQFAYVASHDLKEPLRAVSGCVGLLKRHFEGNLDERAGEYMTHIVDGAVRMETLIDGLLAYSRVGTQGGELQPVESAKALGTALQNLAASIEESGAVVTHDTLPAVDGDLPQLVSLFQNLIGNALKFRKATLPHIHVSAERNGTHWHFSVRDNGIGIAPQNFERIFAVFQRLHTRREYPGTGIGLAICKKIVERHGGRIWVESVPGEGATFSFSLLDAQTNHRRDGGEFHA
jgi:light-regulated signal transduction histidine kinase (bacteriophytochrome)